MTVQALQLTALSLLSSLRSLLLLSPLSLLLLSSLGLLLLDSLGLLLLGSLGLLLLSSLGSLLLGSLRSLLLLVSLSLSLLGLLLRRKPLLRSARARWRGRSPSRLIRLSPRRRLYARPLPLHILR